MRVAIYIRQSDTGGAGAESLSIDSQRAILLDRCERDAWTPVMVEIEPDLKGWQDEEARPAFARILDAASKGDIELVLIYDMSRLARNVEFQERWIRVLGAMGVEIESHTEPEARQHALIRQIKGAVNEERTREIRKHVRRGMQRRAELGLTHGPPPFGYTRQPRQLMQPDPHTAPFVLAAFQQRAAGASTEEIRRYLAERCPTPNGSPQWLWNTVHVMLRNPVYMGTVRSGPVVRENAHPAIVSPDLWHAAQPVPRRYRSRVDTATLSWLSGCVEHACGNRMHLIQPNGSHPGPYFRCANTVSSLTGARSCYARPATMSAHKVELAAWPLVLEVLDRINSPAAVLADARRRYRDQLPDAGKERRSAEAALARAEARRARAEELYLTGSRDRAWFAIEESRAATDIAATADRLAAMPQPPDPAIIEAEIARLTAMRSAAGALTMAQRGAFIAHVGRIVIGDGPIRLVVSPPVAALLVPANLT